MSCFWRKIKNCSELQHFFTYQSCNKCEEGYYLKMNIEKQICLPMKIEKCLNMDAEGNKCKKCQNNYHLLSNGQCFQIPGCLEFEEKCLSCEEQFFLHQGHCISFVNCQIQKGSKCLTCKEGYFLHSAEDYYDYLKNELELSTNFDDLKNMTFPFHQCSKISHCQLSDGISQDCQICYNGYILNQGICIPSLTLIQQIQIFCKIIDQNKCIKCQNLFFILNENCLSIHEEFCTLSDGIEDACIRCSYNGFIINEVGKCEQISNCEISNGIDRCLLCQGSSIANTEGYCQEIESIEFCEIYSFENHFLFESLKIQKEINVTSLICSKCQSFYYITEEGKKCEKIDIDIESGCLKTSGIDKKCLICKGSQQQKLYPKSEKCQVSSYISGCEEYNIFNSCFRCNQEYFLLTPYSCIPRHPFKKCIKYHPLKDECLECRSQFKLKKIKWNNQQINVCIELEIGEQVEHCASYIPNTNICRQCIKRLKQNIVEFILNEQNNKCESVLHLMGSKIDLLTKQCILKYVKNCLEYASVQTSSVCIQCENQFFLKDGNCFQHDHIENCIIYSKQVQDTCEECDQLYYFNYSLSKCVPLSFPQNCLKAHKHKDLCILCETNFAISDNSGQCIKSSINKCVIFSETQNTCLKCFDNFIVLNEGTNCIMRLSEQNCSIFKADNECAECKQGYFLNKENNCIQIDSLCQIQNCQKYHFDSHAERITCETCFSPYIQDQNLECLLFDTDSKSTQETESNNSHQESLKSYLILGIIALVGIGAVLFHKLKLYQKLKNQWLQYHHQQFDHSTQIQMQSSYIE